MTRRHLLAALAGGAAAGAAPYDLLLRGGHVIDPASNVNEPRDVAVAGGKIAAVAKAIPASGARRVVDVSGLYVTPGLIDIHMHAAVDKPQTGLAIQPDLCLMHGLTTIVDAGTHGARGFDAFRKQVIDHAGIRLLAFLNIIDTGMGDEREQDPRAFDVPLCAAAVKKHRDVIVGVKTAHYWAGRDFDARHTPWLAVDTAVAAAAAAGVPVMVDFWPYPPARPYPTLLLEKLRPGDMHTHMFAQQFDLLDGKGRLRDFLAAARKKGILFDVGHGAGSFWFRNAVPAIRQGFYPDSISTDLHLRSWTGASADMLTVASKLLAAGMPLAEIIRRMTVNPARQIRRPELGTLAAGREADIAVLELATGSFGFIDCGRARLTGKQKLEARMTVRAGKIAYDPTGLAAPDWDKAPKQYYTIPVKSTDPRATAEPPASR